VKDCFPKGVCWRSRRDNPVNKWYFERSRGTWKMPDTNWTMFWTTPDLDLDQQRFSDYEGVCRSVVPSWADNKNVVDWIKISRTDLKIFSQNWGMRRALH